MRKNIPLSLPLKQGAFGALLLALAGCASTTATLSPEQCAADWYAVGSADANSGARISRLDEYRAACARGGSALSRLDEEAWRAGYEGAPRPIGSWQRAASVDKRKKEAARQSRDRGNGAVSPRIRPNVGVSVGSGGVRVGGGVGVSVGMFDIGVGAFF